MSFIDIVNEGNNLVFEDIFNYFTSIRMFAKEILSLLR